MQKLTITGGFLIPTGGPPIAPQARGVHLRVLGSDRRHRARRAHSGGLLHAGVADRLEGRRRSADQVQLPRQDGAAGAQRHQEDHVTDKSAKVPGLITFVITGDRGNYPLAPGEAPITVALELNDTGNPQGSTPGTDQCGEVHFKLPSAAAGVHAGTNKLTCK